MSVEELSGSGIKEFFDNLGLEGELLPIEQLYRPGWAEQSGKIFVGIVHSVSNLVDLNEAKMMLVCIHEVDCCFKIGLRLPVTTYNAFAVVLHRIGIKKGDLIAFRSAVVEDYTIPGKSVKIKAHIGLSTIDDAKIFYKPADGSGASSRLQRAASVVGAPLSSEPVTHPLTRNIEIERETDFSCTRIAHVTENGRKYSLYAVVMKITRPLDNDNHGVIRVKDESCAADSYGFRVHIFHKKEVNCPDIQVGDIIRLYNMKTEVYGGTLDGRVFSAKDYVVFPSNGEGTHGASFVNQVIFKESDIRRLAELRRWLSETPIQSQVYISKPVVQASSSQHAVVPTVVAAMSQHAPHLQGVCLSSPHSSLSDSGQLSPSILAGVSHPLEQLSVSIDCSSGQGTSDSELMSPAVDMTDDNCVHLCDISKEGFYSLHCKILDMTVYSERLMILTVCDGTPFKRKEDEGSRRAVVNVRNPRPPINLLQKNSLVCLKNVQVEAVALSAEVPELVLSLTLQGPMGTVRGLSLEESDMLQRRLCFNPPPHSPISAPQRMLPSVSDKRKVESGEDEPARKKGQPSGEDKNKFEASTSCLSNDETLEFVSAGEDPETEINDSERRKYSSDVRNVENVETTTISELLSTEGGAEGQSYLIEALLKDVQPSVGRDLVVLHCCACGEVSNYKKLVHCEVCKNNGSLSRLNKMFLLRLHLEDPEGTGDEMVVTVSDYDAVEFLGCTVLAFLNDSEMFEKITSVLLRLLDESALPRELRPRLKLAVTWEGTTYKVHGTHICDFPN